MPLTMEVGRTAVSIARDAVDAQVSGGKPKKLIPEAAPFTELRGVFVTLNTLGSGPDKLRGCIGFPYPVKPLGEAVREAAIAAATEDPRFPPVSKTELDNIVIEVSVLTPPRQITAKRPQDLPSMVKIGEDGLIVSRFGQSGLLLPQVATEFGMDAMEFLSQTCMKAGLPPDSWLEGGTEVQAFQAEIFGERSPRGEVRRVETPES